MTSLPIRNPGGSHLSPSRRSGPSYPHPPLEGSVGFDILAPITRSFGHSLPLIAGSQPLFFQAYSLLLSPCPIFNHYPSTGRFIATTCWIFVGGLGRLFIVLQLVRNARENGKKIHCHHFRSMAWFVVSYFFRALFRFSLTSTDIFVAPSCGAISSLFFFFRENLFLLFRVFATNTNCITF